MISFSPSTSRSSSSGDSLPIFLPSRRVDSVRTWLIFTQARFFVFTAAGSDWPRARLPSELGPFRQILGQALVREVPRRLLASLRGKAPSFVRAGLAGSRNRA